jgi:hypothetical protein
MAFTSIEALIYAWADREGLRPDLLGRGPIQQLAEDISDHMMPYVQVSRAALLNGHVSEGDVAKVKSDLGAFQTKVPKRTPPAYRHSILVTAVGSSPDPIAGINELTSLLIRVIQGEGDFEAAAATIDIQQLTRGQAIELREQLSEEGT